MRKTGLVWKTIETCIGSLNSNSSKKGVCLLLKRAKMCQRRISIKNVRNCNVKAESVFWHYSDFIFILRAVYVCKQTRCSMERFCLPVLCEESLGSWQVLWQRFSPHYWSKILCIKKLEAPFFRKKKKWFWDCQSGAMAHYTSSSFPFVLIKASIAVL